MESFAPNRFAKLKRLYVIKEYNSIGATDVSDR